MDILYAVLILGGIALLFAIAIAGISRKFAVRKNVMAEEVGKLLAGANCGACGRPGCSAFAESLVAGKVQLSACPVTAREKKTEIAKILGDGATVGDSFKVVVACSGGADCKDKYDYQGYGDCMSVELLAGGRKACATGCIGSSKCSNSCAYGAIKLKKEGYPDVDPALCVGCGNCIFVCPKKIIKRVPQSAVVYLACSSHGRGRDVKEICAHGCIGCSLCKKNCTAGAIEMVDNLPLIDYAKCNGCLTCISKCPQGSIKMCK